MKVVSSGLFIAALVFVGIGTYTFFAGNEHNLSKEINGLAEKSGKPPADKEERARFASELISEYLAISPRAKDSLIKSTAFLGAGSAALSDFEQAKKEYESREKKYEFQRPDSLRIRSAVAYLQEAARICPPGTTGCYSYEIQKSLDYAAGLLSDLPGEKSPTPQIEPTGKDKTESRQKRESSEFSRRGEDGKRMEGSRVDQPPPLKGSVRGKLSKEPESYVDAFDLSALGGGYSENENKP